MREEKQGLIETFLQTYRLSESSVSIPERDLVSRSTESQNVLSLLQRERGLVSRPYE